MTTETITRIETVTLTRIETVPGHYDWYAAGALLAHGVPDGESPDLPAGWEWTGPRSARAPVRAPVRITDASPSDIEGAREDRDMTIRITPTEIPRDHLHDAWLAAELRALAERVDRGSTHAAREDAREAAEDAFEALEDALPDGEGGQAAALRHLVRTLLTVAVGGRLPEGLEGAALGALPAAVVPRMSSPRVPTVDGREWVRGDDGAWRIDQPPVELG